MIKRQRRSVTNSYNKGLTKLMLDSIQSETHKEVLAIRGIEKRLMKEDRLTTYIACEELNFTWSDEQVRNFDEHWKRGKACGLAPYKIILEIANEFNRNPEEVAILALDRGMKGGIK
ncbi:hypothetical protein H4O14_02235 [Bacillus sp. PAMC26568]|nr:hypothetical protein H4O14_02235 [Bacillus sp. PAMC26568]